MGDKDDVYRYTDEEISFLSEKISEEEAYNRRIRALFLSVFESEAGKQVLAAIKSDVCGINATCFDANPVEMARKAGRQEVAYAIESIMALARDEAKEESDDNRL